MNIYQTCYDLINTYIYGGSVVAETYTDLVCIALSTLACVLVFAFPFLVAWRIMRIFL